MFRYNACKGVERKWRSCYFRYYVACIWIILNGTIWTSLKISISWHSISPICHPATTQPQTHNCGGACSGAGGSDHRARQCPSCLQPTQIWAQRGTACGGRGAGSCWAAERWEGTAREPAEVTHSTEGKQKVEFESKILGWLESYQTYVLTGDIAKYVLSELK